MNWNPKWDRKWDREHRRELLAYYRKSGADHRAFLDSLKEGKPCLDCKKVFPPYVMEFDHVRGEKRHNLGKMGNHRRERVLEEIAKCDLVCCVCHRIRGHRRRPPARTPRLINFRTWIFPFKNVPCQDCVQRFPPEAMDFDHVRGEKVETITDMWSWSRARVLSEIAKCEVVCANCHRIRTVRTLRSSPAFPPIVPTTENRTRASD